MNDRFLLVIKITKGDEIGQALTMMSHGVCIGFDDFQKAINAWENFVKLAKAVIKGAKFRTYGMACVMDDRDGCCHCCEAIYDGENAQ